MKIWKWKIRRRQIVRGAWAAFAVFAIVSMILGSAVLGIGSLR